MTRRNPSQYVKTRKKLVQRPIIKTSDRNWKNADKKKGSWIRGENGSKSHKEGPKSKTSREGVGDRALKKIQVIQGKKVTGVVKKVAHG